MQQRADVAVFAVVRGGNGTAQCSCSWHQGSRGAAAALQEASDATVIGFFNAAITGRHAGKVGAKLLKLGLPIWET